MFKFLKDKLKGAIAAITGKAEGEKKPEPEPVVAPEVPTTKELKPSKRQQKEAPVPPAPSADDIENIIKGVDVHVPLQGESEPEPVPAAPEAEDVLVHPPLAPKPKNEPEVVVPAPVKRVEPQKPKTTSQERRVEPVKPTPVSQSVPASTPAPVAVERPQEKQGFFSRITQAITTTKISDADFDNLFWELEVALLENNVAVEVIEKIKADLRQAIVGAPIPRGKVEETVAGSLRKSIEEVLAIEPIDLVERARQKKPFIIAFVGVNGSGKTTTIAKVAKMLLDNDLSVVLAAGDTFRAAAIDQLELHANRLGVKIVKHDYGADPAAVAFDAIKHAQAKDVDVVLIDTAGRLHSNINLVDEMKKIMRVAKPDMKIFVGESITGNDCIEQAKQFNEAIGIDGIVLAKADVDEKGGAALSVSYVTGKPVLYLGVGQEYGDLEPFEREKIIASLGL